MLLEQDEALRRQLRGAALPEWIDGSRSKLHQFEKYVCNVFGLPDLLASFVDTGEHRKFLPSTWSTAYFTRRCCASRASTHWKGIEGKRFSEAHWPFAHPDVKAFSADVVANVLDKLETGWHPQSERGGHRQSGAKQNLSRRLRCAALRGHRRLGTIFLLRSALPELFSAQGQSEATHGRARRSGTVLPPLCGGPVARAGHRCGAGDRTSAQRGSSP